MSGTESPNPLRNDRSELPHGATVGLCRERSIRQHRAGGLKIRWPSPANL